MCTQYYYIAVLCFKLVNLVMIISTANYSIYTLKLNLPLKNVQFNIFVRVDFRWKIPLNFVNLILIALGV